MKNQRNEIIVVDWKRARTMNFENAHRSLKHPLEHIPDSTSQIAGGWGSGSNREVGACDSVVLFAGSPSPILLSTHRVAS